MGTPRDVLQGGLEAGVQRHQHAHVVVAIQGEGHEVERELDIDALLAGLLAGSGAIGVATRVAECGSL